MWFEGDQVLSGVEQEHEMISSSQERDEDAGAHSFYSAWKPRSWNGGTHIQGKLVYSVKSF